MSDTAEAVHGRKSSITFTPPIPRAEGSALIRGILDRGVRVNGFLHASFGVATQAELRRIAETLEIAEAMESLAPAAASPATAYRCTECHRLGTAEGVGFPCGYSCNGTIAAAEQYSAPPPATAPDRAGADAMREALEGMPIGVAIDVLAKARDHYSRAAADFDAAQCEEAMAGLSRLGAALAREVPRG